MRTQKLLPLALFLASTLNLHAADKPKLTLDEFFDWVEIEAVQISPDGNSVVIQTDRADWDQNIYRDDLWLYRDSGQGGTLVQFTQSGHDTHPEWSFDGRWIAFLSSRKNPPGKDSDSGDANDGTVQIYLISPAGGEAFPVTRGDEEVHSFAWSADSRTIYFAIRTPSTKAQTDAYKKEWKDVLQYRAAERGDTIYSIDVANALARATIKGNKPAEDSEDDVTPGARPIASTPLRVSELVASPDGRKLAFMTTSVSQREEKTEEFEIYSVDLKDSATQPPHQLTHNQAQEQNLRWAKDSKHIFFLVQYGAVEGKYKDTQARLYSVDADSAETQRWAKGFDGAILGYSAGPDGGIVATGRLGTEVQMYSQRKPSEPFSKIDGWSGTYEFASAAANSPPIAFMYSALEKPNEVYIAASLDKLAGARPITSFNKLFTERDLPKGKLYHWKADDGTSLEGMLMFPPGKFEAKNLPTFVFIHGGPDDADGNHFQADWYVWDRLAATHGWLVFEANYRGSIGYGDKFMSDAVPEMESRPGKDILAGVDALVRDGIADPAHLAVGGYSAGGYLTNWLITQTTRFKAAVTGGGAVENVIDWGNDDTTFDDAYYLGGTPWQARQHYEDEAAIFQIDKVRTPTHIVVGADDIRVAADEAYLLDHALFNLGVPSQLLVFPGEGHDLEKNPWHGKIKVREELNWLQKYGGVGNPQ
jgi:dipeptidyl aminopeptidase/acylaminoacyl peptidase